MYLCCTNITVVNIIVHGVHTRKYIIVLLSIDYLEIGYSCIDVNIFEPYKMRYSCFPSDGMNIVSDQYIICNSITTIVILLFSSIFFTIYEINK